MWQPMTPLFKNRVEAGRRLAAALAGYAGRSDLVVLALPRGGVPVAYEIARALGAPLDVFVVRKLGVPGRPELAMGAIASGGVRVLNHSLIEALGISPAVVETVAAQERREMERRERAYRQHRPPLDVRGRWAILVDDGLATGATMRAAAVALRELGPARTVVAVPAAAREACEELRRHVDEILCAETPEPFVAVGVWYEDFTQTTDDEVRALLEQAPAPTSPPSPESPCPPQI
jgi:putative phosphoribosyl transferase